jgi:hypothetical protein
MEDTISYFFGFQRYYWFADSIYQGADQNKGEAHTMVNGLVILLGQGEQVEIFKACCPFQAG